MQAARARSSRAPSRLADAADARDRDPAVEVADGCPIPAFLIHHPSAGPVPRRHRPARLGGGEARREPRPIDRRASPGPRIEPGQDLPAQLRARGVDPKAIKLVVMTHMHFDHTSGMAEFPDATFVVSEDEWDGGDHRLAAVPARLPPRPLRLRLRLPHGRLRLRARSPPTRPSAAPSTSSATAACGSPPPPATAPGTSR